MKKTAREELKNKKRIVIKIGSSSLTHPETGDVNLVKIERLIRVISDLRGMGFTPDGRRLGKGGGYYDCFLEREPDHETLALAYGFQMVETLPGEEHDRPVDMVITPEQIFFSGRHRGK